MWSRAHKVPTFGFPSSASKTRRHGLHQPARLHPILPRASRLSHSCSPPRRCCRHTLSLSAVLSSPDSSLASDVYADQILRTMPSQYEPLGQEAPDNFFHAESSSRVNTAFPPKPEIYYGEGPFDPPSSDDDESEVLLEKNGSQSSSIFEEEGHLVVGNSKVRPLYFTRPAPTNAPLLEETASLFEVPNHRSRISRFCCCHHRRIRREIIHRYTVSRTRRPAPHYGSLFQRHFLYN